MPAKNPKKPHQEVSEEELVEQLTDGEAEQLTPLGARATSVSEADWVEQQREVPVDDEEREA